VSERPRVCWGLRACTRSSQSHSSQPHWLSSPRPRACTTSQKCCTPRLVGHSLNDAVALKSLAPRRWTVYRRARHTLSRTPPQEEIAVLDTISCIKTSPHFPSWLQMLLACFVRPSNFTMAPVPRRPAAATQCPTGTHQTTVSQSSPTYCPHALPQPHQHYVASRHCKSVRAVPICGYQSAQSLSSGFYSTSGLSCEPLKLGQSALEWTLSKHYAKKPQSSPAVIEPRMPT